MTHHNKIEKADYLLFILLTFLTLSASTGCSTKKNTSISRGYHNLTARYNVYFNGNESLKSGLEQSKKSSKEDYTKILTVFNYEVPTLATSISSSMDLTIKKCAKTIKTHSITTKPKIDSKKISKDEKEFLAKQEYCKLIDDAYLLMGKAHFYKREFETALQTFLLITNKFKKESSNDEALLWIAKTYAETGEYANAENTLAELKKLRRFDKNYLLEIDLTLASIYLKKKDFINAAQKLNTVIKTEKNKKEKARHIFILAQIYQADNKFKLAADNYEKVIKMNPDYDMTFAAKISMAELFEKSGNNSDELKKQLTKMVKDEKNIDYLDQLYYALGKIEMNNKNEKLAVSDFHKSARATSSNKFQKVKTFRALAEYYYTNKNYYLGEAYYDSTALSIDINSSDYNTIHTNTINLKDVNHNLFVVVKEDSLQLLAKMSETDRNNIIDAIIQRIVEEEQKQNEAKINATIDPNLLDNNDYYRTNNSTEGGKYYFYNPSIISIGQTEFKKKWGDRKLEDNWRRVNKQSVIDIQNIVEKNDSNTVNKEDEKSKITNIKSRDYYLQDIPLTPEKMTESNKRIEKAMLTSGEIYYKQLNETGNATIQFEKLLFKFPQSEFKFETLRYLYQISNKEMNFAAAEKYKQQIIKEFPDNSYSKLLKDPTYADMLLKKEKEINNLYDLALKSYKNKDFTQTIILCENADKNFSGNDLQANFIYLKAISYGESGNKEALKTNLEILVNQFPQSEPTKTASATLEVINSKKLEKEIYSLKKDTIHYYVLVYPKARIDANKLKFKFIKLNVDKYTQSDLVASIQTLDSERDIIIVQKFKNATEAMEYFQNIITNNVLEDIQKYTPVHFVISAENFQYYIKNKEDLKYMNFFDKNYLVN